MSPDGVHPSDMFDDDSTIAAFARDLTDAAAVTPPPVVGAALASMLEAGVAAPRADVPAVKAPRRAWRLRSAVGGVVFGLGVGGLGVAGALPDLVQEQVSRVADVVGVHLPDGKDEPATTTSTTTPPATTPTTVLPAPTTAPPNTTPPPAHTTVVTDDHGDDGGGDDDSSGNGNGNGNGNDSSDDHSGPGSGGVEGDDNDPVTSTTVEADDHSGKGGSGHGDEPDDEPDDGVGHGGS